MKNLHSKLLLMLLAVLLISNGYSQTCPTGIVSFWKFDDASDVLFDDFVSNHNGESETSISTLATGKVGAAKYLGGTDVITVPDHSAFDFAANTSFSIECWVNYSNYNLGTNQVIIGKKNSTGTGSYWFLGIENGTGRVIFEVQAANDTYKDIYSPATLGVDTWHHIVGIRDESTNTNKLYVDGTMVNSVTYDYTGSFSSDGPITIGAFTNSSGVPDYFYKGYIDETVIYNRALTATEIADHILKNNNGIGLCEGLSPIIKSNPVTTGIVNQEYKYQVVATGMPTISYSLIKAPATMTISPEGAISWTPATLDDDGYVELRVNNDAYPPADTQRFRIFLADAPACPDGISILLKLDETSGPIYADYYNEHNATAVVAPAATAGKIKGGQAFSASTGVDIPENNTEFNWNYTSNFSIELWMKIPEGNLSTMVAIGRHRITGDPADDNVHARWWVGTDDLGQATFELQDNKGTPKSYTISGETNLADGNWHHIIAVRNGSAQENRLYVDGIKVNTIATDYANSFAADTPTPISIGYWKRDGNNYHFTGALDEIAIFNKAISDAEASSFFNGNQPTGHCAINNYPPVITSTAVTDATEDVPYSYTFTVEDIDADIITLGAPTKPNWLSFNYIAGQKTATLTGTPTNAEVGTHNVVLTVNDGKVTKNQSFTITVANVNDAPVITSTAILTGYVGNLYAYVFTATDVDANTTLTLSAVEKPEWLSFTPSNGILSGTPTEKGNNVVSLRVSDGTVDVDQTFTIVVDGPTGLNELSAAGIGIYPVPAKDYLTVTCNAFTEDAKLEVINALGSLVLTSVIPANQTNHTIDLKGIENGIYYLHIQNSSINNVSRFVVTK